MQNPSESRTSLFVRIIKYPSASVCVTASSSLVLLHDIGSTRLKNEPGVCMCKQGWKENTKDPFAVLGHTVYKILNFAQA